MTNRTKIIELLVWYLRSGTEEAGVSFSLKKKSERGVLFVSQWDSVCFYVLIMAICSLCDTSLSWGSSLVWHLNSLGCFTLYWVSGTKMGPTTLVSGVTPRYCYTHIVCLLAWKHPPRCSFLYCKSEQTRKGIFFYISIISEPFVVGCWIFILRVSEPYSEKNGCMCTYMHSGGGGIYYKRAVSIF